MTRPTQAAVRHPGAPSRHQVRWCDLGVELLLLLAGVAVYFAVRGVTVTSPQKALSNARDLVHLEKALGIYVEPALQGVVAGSSVLMTAMNWVYIWGHWPVIAAVLLWLYLRHPDGYRTVRNTMLLSGGIGLAVFALYPLAPPRLAPLGLVDTVTELSTSYRVLQPPAFVNQYAAMPSLHVGWDLLMGVALITWSTVRVVRVIGLVLPPLMVLSVILTANHYVADAVAGAALVLVCLAVVQWWSARRPEVIVLPGQRRAEQTTRPSQAADPHPSRPR